jgi:hypothetical protein
MFKKSMASAIPQLQFDACMCGATLDDGVEILFRESSGKFREALRDTDAEDSSGLHADEINRQEPGQSQRAQADESNPGK